MAAIFRFTLSGLLGGGAAFGLFVLMTLLINVGGVDIVKPDFLRIDDVVQPPEEIITTAEIDVPEREQNEPPPETPEAPPEVPQDAVLIAAPRQNFSSGIDYGAIKIAPGSGARQPIFRVNPQYPARAASRGVTGWVLVVFDIDTDGRVVNPRVLDNEPNSIFDAAAMRAIRKWRYTPEVQDGQAVYVADETVRLVFNLAE